MSHIPPAVERVVYTVNEACVALRISRATIYALMKQGRLKYFYIQSARRIPASEINQFVSEAST